MQIFNSAKQEPKTKYLLTISNPSNPIAFGGGFTRVLQKRPTLSPALIQMAKDIYTRDKGFGGIFPCEFVNAIKNNLKTHDKNQIKICVEGVRETFAKATELFNKIDEETNKNIESYIDEYNFNDCIRVFLEKIKIKLQVLTCPSLALKSMKKAKDKNKAAPEFIKDIEKQVADALNCGLKKYRLIPEDSTVFVNRLDEGRFGTAYEISFICRNKNVLRSKVIKYYKNLYANIPFRVKLALKREDIINGEYHKVLSFFKELFKIFPSHKTIKKSSSESVEFKKDNLAKKITEQITMQLKRGEYKHGKKKEANVGNYIMKASGHDLQRSDIISYFYTDLEHNYALFEFCSYDNIGPVTKKVDYDSLGITPKDIVGLSKLKNFLCGRIIDIGGFEVTNKVLAENKVARRTYKKIKHITGRNPKNVVQQRVKRFNELYKTAQHNKLPQSSDILLGLEEARRLIPRNKRKSLFNKSLNKD